MSGQWQQHTYVPWLFPILTNSTRQWRNDLKIEPSWFVERLPVKKKAAATIPLLFISGLEVLLWMNMCRRYFQPMPNKLHWYDMSQHNNVVIWFKISISSSSTHMMYACKQHCFEWIGFLWILFQSPKKCHLNIGFFWISYGYLMDTLVTPLSILNFIPYFRTATVNRDHLNTKNILPTQPCSNAMKRLIQMSQGRMALLHRDIPQVRALLVHPLPLTRRGLTWCAIWRTWVWINFSAWR